MKTETVEFTYTVTLKVKYSQIDPEYLAGEVIEPNVTKGTVAKYFKTLVSPAEEDAYFNEYCSADLINMKIKVS